MLRAKFCLALSQTGTPIPSPIGEHKPIGVLPECQSASDSVRRSLVQKNKTVRRLIIEPINDERPARCVGFSASAASADAYDPVLSPSTNATAFWRRLAGRWQAFRSGDQYGDQKYFPKVEKKKASTMA